MALRRGLSWFAMLLPPLILFLLLLLQALLLLVFSRGLGMGALTAGGFSPLLLLLLWLGFMALGLMLQLLLVAAAALNRVVKTLTCPALVALDAVSIRALGDDWGL